MATKAKTERNYKPAHAAPQPAKRKTDTRKIVKALIFGPTIAILGVTLLYLAWWGISKAFTVLHSVVTAYFVPWVSANWPIIVGVWALVALTSGLYFFYEQYLKQKKTQKPVNKNQSVSEQTETNPKRKAPTSTLFDVKPDTEFSTEELDKIGAYPYVPVSKVFTAGESEIPEGFEEVLEKVFPSSKNENKNPENFISGGKPSET